MEIAKRMSSISPPVTSSPYRTSPMMHSPSRLSPNKTWGSQAHMKGDDGPLNLTKPKFEIKTERFDNGYLSGMRNETTATPPPAHNNHRRQSTSSTPPAETPTSFMGLRTPFGLSQYVANPFMLGQHLQSAAAMSNMGHHPALMNKHHSDIDKVGNKLSNL